MKKIFLSFVALVSCVLAASAQPAETTLPYIDKCYTLGEDGSVELRVRMSRTYNTHSSFFSMFGESFIEYNPEYQSLTINESYTRQADGTITKAPANSLNEVLPRSAAGAPAYNHLKEMVVTHVGMELGATAYLDYTLTSKAEMMDGELDFTEILPQYASDVRKITITVNLPEGKTLRAATIDATGKCKTQVIKGSYTWTFSDLKGFYRESGAPAEIGKARLYATTFRTLDDAIRTMYYDTRDIFRLDPARMGDDKVSSVATYVRDMVATISINPALTGYRHAPARVVDARCYGSSLDKVFMLNKMLLAEGAECDLMVQYPVDCPVKNLSGHTAVAVKATIDGKTTWLDHNGSSFDPTTKADRYVWISMISGKAESLEHKADIAENSYNIAIAGSKAVITTNGNEASKREVGIVEVDGTTGVMQIAVPLTSDGISSLGTLNTLRREPFELYNAVNRKESYTITLDSGKFLTTPRTESVKNSVGKASYTIEVDGATATITRTIAIGKSIIYPSEWAQLRALVLAYAAPKTARTLLAK